jgi:hypothetical protein
MGTIPVRSVDAVDSALVDTVQQTFGGQRSLADLLRWCGDQTPRVQIVEIVTQDEYTHDVIVPFGSAFLSFDTT